MNDSLVFLSRGQAEAATGLKEGTAVKVFAFRSHSQKFQKLFMSKWLEDTVSNKQILETGDIPNQNGQFRI